MASPAVQLVGDDETSTVLITLDSGHVSFDTTNDEALFELQQVRKTLDFLESLRAT
jgi:hypothetical protein